jgi:hypothetical protein
MKKQTAVAWLQKELSQISNLDFSYWLSEARKMEQEQIEDAFIDGKQDLSDERTKKKFYENSTHYFHKKYVHWL